MIGRWFRALFAWRFIGTMGAWVYYENAVTGARSARLIPGIVGPQNRAWLSGEVSSLSEGGRRSPPRDAWRAV